MPDADAPLGEPAFSESLLPQAEAASEGALRPWSGVSGLSLATVTVPLDRWSRSYSPGGRGAGNGVALANKVH